MNPLYLFNLRYKQNKRTLVLLIVCLLALCLTNCSSQTSAPLSTQPTTIPVAMSQPSNGDINANGVLLPNHQLMLSFGVSGLVESVAVGLGENVQAGQLLVQLDTTEAQMGLKQAEAELAAAQENYALVEANSPAEQEAALATAAFELLAAQQALEMLYINADADRASAFNQVVAANDAVGEAKYKLYYFTIPTTLADLDPSEALALAIEQLDQARDAYEPFKNQPAEEVFPPNRKLTLIDQHQQDLKDRLDGAQRDYNTAQRQLELEAALLEAETWLEEASRDYERLQNGPNPDDVAIAEARVANAQAQYDLVSGEGQAAQQLAQAQLEVDTAQANLQHAQTQLDKLTLSAPLDGMISAIHIDEGEWAMPGEVVMEMLDLSSWLIETKNVGELQIGQVEIGQEAQVRFNAFQSEIVNGHVIAISPQAVVQQGDITYTLVIALEPTDLNLRPGMTARVEISIE
jgi:multidrug resistance efflux pump